MTKDEIIALIDAKIAGQGTMVDAGSALPAILKGILEIAVGGENVQSDWNEADNTKPDYIKNKPTIPTAHVVDVTVSGNIFYANGLNDGVVMQRLARGEITIIHWQQEDEDFYSIIQTGAGGGNSEAYNPRTQRYMSLD